MSAEDLLKPISSVGEAARSGKGLLGKSTVAILLVETVLGVGIWKLESDGLRLVGMGLATFLFLTWFLYIARHTRDYPDSALLEGAEWFGYKQFEMTSKSLRAPPQQQPSPYPPTIESAVDDTEPESEE
ncbi:MAG: hypothetical protein O7H41_17065 [Planctomycetota bacterium]|nr:hypothetical protein [Planctomycetota bacterium]